MYYYGARISRTHLSMRMMVVQASMAGMLCYSIGCAAHTQTTGFIPISIESFYIRVNRKLLTISSGGKRTVRHLPKGSEIS